MSIDPAGTILTVAAVVGALIIGIGGIGQLRGSRHKDMIAAQAGIIDMHEKRRVETDRRLAELEAQMVILRSSWIKDVGHEIAVEVGREVSGAVNAALLPFLDSLNSRLEAVEGRRPPTTRSRASDK